MRKEHIMTEEERRLKRKKVEMNRAKRKQASVINADQVDSSSESISSLIKMTNTTAISQKPNESVLEHVINSQTTISSTTEQYKTDSHQSTTFDYPTKESNASTIVNFFINYPSESNNYINHLMYDSNATLEVMTKIIQSQRDAMKMIGHLIRSPGDALKIIGKLMNSPFHALNVFTKFMASPSDALEIIAKVSSHII